MVKISVYLNRRVFVMSSQHYFGIKDFYHSCQTAQMFALVLIITVLRNITKTCLYNFDPLKPHFYIVKLGFTGVYITFLISVQNIDCGYSLEPPR